MLPLLATLAVGLFLLWGAFKLGQRSVGWALSGTAVLFPIAWRLLQVDAPVGEGAAAGVVVISFLIWVASGLTLLLAAALLLGAIRAHDSRPAKVALGLLLAAAILMIQHRVALNRPATAAERTMPPSALPAPRVEGYTRAIDEGLMADSACHGDSMFVLGCKAGVARNTAR